MNLAFDAATQDGAQVGLGKRYGPAAERAQRRAGQQQQQLRQQQDSADPGWGQGSVADFAAAPWNIGAAGQQARPALG